MVLNFYYSDQILKAASLYDQQHDKENDTERAVAFQGFLSMEVAMTYLLEQSGTPAQAILDHNHSILELLEALDSLHKNGEELEPWDKLWGQVVDETLQNGSVGSLLSEAAKGSKYPNQMGVGSQIHCIEPRLVLKTAGIVLDWCKSNASELLYVTPQGPSTPIISLR